MFSHNDAAEDHRWAVLVGATTSGSSASQHWFQGFLKACRQRKLMICGVDFEGSMATKTPPIPLDCLITVPGEYTRELSKEALAQVVDELHNCRVVEVALSVALRENYQIPNSQLVETLGLRGNSIQCIELIQDKPACRDALRRAGVVQPRSLRIAGVESDGNVRAVDSAGIPVETRVDLSSGWIVKPATGMGSVGVSYVTDPGELAALGPEVGAGSYCLEEFIHGEEFSVEAITVAGRVRLYAATAKTTNEWFVETGHRQPAPPHKVPPTEDLALQLQACVTALGIRWGHLHAEFWVVPDGSVVWGEFHVRQGGDFIAPDLVEAVRPGLDFYGELVNSLSGVALDELAPVAQYAGVNFIETASGRVVATALADQVPTGVVVHWDCKPGDTVTALNGLRARVAAVVARADDEESLESLLTGVSDGCECRVVSQVRIDV
ncbi:ATP-grasp domain-containing protein [Raineyella sp.]|nr:ATP-grasp domain-containing protein [Raineyella sp.]MEA5153824.1 ATP-grasp domain-containing protein [Raineyella sp.]